MYIYICMYICIYNGPLQQEISCSRSARFGANLVDVQIKPPLLILVDEVLHPFYIFQVGPA